MLTPPFSFQSKGNKLVVAAVAVSENVEMVRRAFLSKVQECRRVIQFGCVDECVCCYNWATSPSEERTNAEHKICGKIARKLLSRLQMFEGWHENEDGYILFN